MLKRFYVSETTRPDGGRTIHFTTPEGRELPNVLSVDDDEARGGGYVVTVRMRVDQIQPEGAGVALYVQE